MKKSQYQITKFENNLIGKRFGNLEVIESSKHRQNRYRCWLCKCDCGNVVEVTSSHLKVGNTTTCGCGRWQRNNKSPYWKGFGEISITFFNQIKRNADVRNHKFDVTIEQIWELFINQNRKCSLTGLDLNFQNYSKHTSATASLDRIDSTKGYTIDNVQWIHKDVNLMKRNFKEEKLFEYCKLIYHHKKLI